MPETSVLEVNLSAVARNMQRLRAWTGEGCGLCPIVKADAYGLGAARIARQLVLSGADLLAVYSTEQAAHLARSGVGGPILVLMPVHEIERADELYRGLISGQLHLVLHDEEHWEAIERIAERYGAVVPVHLEVDTGLGRGGCVADEAARLARRIATTRWVRLAGLFTHFSNARDDDAATHAQLARYEALVAEIADVLPPECVQHVASTYALLRRGVAERGRVLRRMVRFGLAWAGYGADEIAPDQREPIAASLEPCVTWSSRIVQTKSLEAGSAVGYGSLWRAQRRSVVGLVPVGYADGFPVVRAGRSAMLAAQEGPTAAAEIAVAIRSGATTRMGRAPVIGAINMDQVSVDLTDLLREGEVGVGSRVEIVSADRAAPNHLPRLAAAAGTIPHEFLSRISPRIRRVYVGDAVATPMETQSEAGARPRAAAG